MDIQIDNALRMVAGVAMLPPIAVPYKTVRETYAVLDTDLLIFANSNSGAFTITLPSASERGGREFRFIRTNAGSEEDITITPVNGGNIVLDQRYDVVTVVSDGSDWYATADVGV